MLNNSTVAYYQSFLIDYKGIKGLTEGIDNAEQFLTVIELEEYDKEQGNQKTYTTELRNINGPETVFILNNQSVFHFIIKANIFNLKSYSVFMFNNCYSSEIFQRIILNSRAAEVSTAGELQYLAL